MELILKPNNVNSAAKIIALAKKLNIPFEQKEAVNVDVDQREELKKNILNFKANGPSSFGDAADWQNDVRKDRDLPFSG